ncbi:hypothetical protein LTR85_004574 [Meristemomyces frigidus]|nr:hypothetical protein LTR85_004574 [Meristemomyces frigidus]
MPSIKRALQDTQSKPVKRIRLSADELEDLDKDALITKVIELQQQLDDVIKQSATKEAAAATAASKPAAMTDEQAAQKAEQARKLMIKGIKSQMKWKASCKTGAAKFSYSGAVPSARVFNELMGQPADSKKKMLTFTPLAFCDDVAKEDISSSARYSYLNLTGEKVNIRWKEDEGAFTVNGSYGS